METLTKKVAGYRFSIWPEPGDDEFVWVYSKRDKAHITGNIGPLNLEEYPELKAKDKKTIDAGCLRAVREMLESEESADKAYSGGFGYDGLSPDGFPILKYFPEYALPAIISFMSTDMWRVWETEHPNVPVKTYTFYEVFVNYLKHFGINPCIYSAECSRNENLLHEDFFIGRMPHHPFGWVFPVSKDKKEDKRCHYQHTSLAAKCGIDYIVSVNSELPIDERRFTHGHELAHILIGYVEGHRLK